MTRTISTGQLSTLGTYRDNCAAVGFLKAVAYFDDKITKSPSGRDEEVIADEQQMLQVIIALEGKQ